eukprot:TRINITY_DN69172_c0_g1_i1.p2 TRINITY_DN69172_c0_g1~~TRINITY_DN69172_c0_g1_i1.p2  ORF type:complete len:166 (-),score=18.25 TRINITY_DN69172_c0_g1_i1:268-765(-)
MAPNKTCVAPHRLRRGLRGFRRLARPRHQESALHKRSSAMLGLSRREALRKLLQRSVVHLSPQDDVSKGYESLVMNLLHARLGAEDLTPGGKAVVGGSTDESAIGEGDSDANREIRTAGEFEEISPIDDGDPIVAFERALRRSPRIRRSRVRVVRLRTVDDFDRV